MFLNCSSAADYFDAVRDASLEVERINNQLERMRSAGGRSALAQRVSATRSDVNGTGRSISLLDYEQRVRASLATDERIRSAAVAVLYGDAGDGGLSSLLPGPAADVIWWRCLAASTWPQTADAVGLSERWCRQLAQTAFDLLDAVGADGAREGSGIAV